MRRPIVWGAFLLLLPLGVVRGVGAVPPRPLLMLFPRSQTEAADSRALFALRTRLRDGGRLDVLSFDPDAPSVRRAAADAGHPEWLAAPVTSDAERLDITRAVGAAFAAVVGKADKDKAAVHLLEAAPPARVWDYPASSINAVAENVERQATRPSLPAAEVPPVVTKIPPAIVLPPPAVTPVPVAPPPAVTPAPVAPPPAVTPAPVAPPPATVRQPTSPAFVVPPDTGAADLAAVQPLITLGDRAVARGDMVEAYSHYRDAINGAPLSDVPRLKLAQAYLLGGLPEKALNEAQRALEIAPNSIPVEDFLIKFDAENGTTAGSVARYRALVAKNPQNTAAHLGLGDALWNGSEYAGAESEYKSARDLAPANSDARRDAIAHLARLYAATGRYSDCQEAMKAAGDAAYPLVLGIVQNAADTLVATIDTSHSAFDAGNLTRADFYAKMQAASTKSQGLADFVAKITPPGKYSRSHLDRVQGMSLLAQAAAVTVNFIESNDIGRRDKAAQLEKDAQTEMLTAHAAEQKLGLWVGEKGGEDKPLEDKG